MRGIRMFYAAMSILCVALPVKAEKPAGLPGGYPTKPVRVIIASGPAGALDISGRLVARHMSERWASSFFAENRTGTGLAYDFASKAVPDGYTLMVSSTSISYAAHGVQKVPYDVRKKFPPIGQFFAAPFVATVTLSLPVNSMKELLAYAKANPNKLNYAHTGPGTSAHLAGELLKLLTKIDIVGIPFKAVGAAYIEQMAGRVHLTFGTAASVMPLVRSGKVRAIAVTTEKRAKSLPDLPAIAETLPNFDNIDVWVGLLGIEGMPQPIIAALNKEVNAILQLPDIEKVLMADGAETTPRTPEHFGRVIASAIESTDRIIRDAGIKLK